ncbi:uncharacterized protein BDZ99DRAFT_189264 [Mytilinidion resinicola]|uniref:Uncharacterized protein n=1 Tax=Mytilinidion resinicola TaxID=574789 RepID=A0A6A6Z2K6_9PEZI|nr:uncharacterized protein BDZ99DRAFT_189264 [Mytilinidion resinicola]KAF2815038.1 hypothetical protein BDZ99DRAFT_189264 [Mytilinidion resinicola]
MVATSLSSSLALCPISFSWDRRRQIEFRFRCANLLESPEAVLTLSFATTFVIVHDHFTQVATTSVSVALHPSISVTRGNRGVPPPPFIGYIYGPYASSNQHITASSQPESYEPGILVHQSRDAFLLKYDNAVSVPWLSYSHCILLPLSSHARNQSTYLPEFLDSSFVTTFD